VTTAEDALRAAFRAALSLPGAGDGRVRISGPATLRSAYPVSELASASVWAAAAALAALTDALGFPPADAVVSRPLADAWFGLAVAGVGWAPPPPWDEVAGDYRAADGWIRLHTNAPHHRVAALRVLGAPADRAKVTDAVAGWPASALQEAVVAEGGCAAELLTPDRWQEHAQGRAVAGLPLVDSRPTGPAEVSPTWRPRPERPLAGLRVLDLTRVLAGPAATRLLAGLGADVLRIDPPSWDEPALVPEMTLGKCPARLDAGSPQGRSRLRALVASADVLVHGYRAGALEHLGLSPAERDELRPGLVDVSLTAYGQAGPWAGRRGFDSLVQMSTGIAAAGLVEGSAERPTPLPVQALDHATGYAMAAAVLRGLAARVTDRRGSRAMLSLARTAWELERVRGLPRVPLGSPPPTTATRIETPWGPADVLPPPIEIEAGPIRWTRAPSPLGSAEPEWPGEPRLR
jgi:crotonobetainyl-CoA:carnitine CoA-transferase CaiB-like acyl-CoA transferase